MGVAIILRQPIIVYSVTCKGVIMKILSKLLLVSLFSVVLFAEDQFTQPDTYSRGGDLDIWKIFYNPALPDPDDAQLGECVKKFWPTADYAELKTNLQHQKTYKTAKFNEDIFRGNFGFNFCAYQQTISGGSVAKTLEFIFRGIDWILNHKKAEGSL
jgi:hypothetical protein